MPRAQAAVALSTLTLLIAPDAAAAEPSAYPVTLMGGLSVQGAAVGGMSLGGVGTGRVIIHGKKLSLDFAGGEGVANQELRHVGAVFVGARKPFGPDLYGRFGFYHQHETPWEDFVSSPVGTIAAVDDHIFHRSGAQLAVGWLRPWDVAMTDDPWRRVMSGVELSVAALPDDSGPKVIVGFEVSAGFGVGERRR
ncbi:MAG: hypothetical protein IPO67_21325 [Deltaproteobacteria bacterium]|nr:hypothetical protein [Deltaproteobacteria bacterium]